MLFMSVCFIERTLHELKKLNTEDDNMTLNIYSYQNTFLCVCRDIFQKHFSKFGCGLRSHIS